METDGTPDRTQSSEWASDPQACGRCGGLLLLQEYIDLRDDTGQIGITARHCSICGEVVDPVILRNRRRPPPNLLYGAKQRKFSQSISPRRRSDVRRETVDHRDRPPGR